MGIPMRCVPGLVNSRPGIQVGTIYRSPIGVKNGSPVLDPEYVNYMKQIGVEWVMLTGVPEHSVRFYREVREKLEENGLKLFRLANNEMHNMPDVTLGLAKRDEMTDRYLEYITNLAEAGIYYATYAHMGNGIWRDDYKRPVRGGAVGGGLDYERPNRSIAFGDFTWPLSHGRVFSEDEIWENYERFIKKVVPVAEQAGIYIGIHPDDPPGGEVAGVPRCIFSSFEGYKKAFEIADSPNIGACLCVGCWLEGGDRMGASPEEFIRWLAAEKKLFKLHIRNVTQPLYAPGGFNETFPDAGYYDLTKTIRALADVDFDGVVINDHLIDMVGGYHACEAYFTAWIKGAVDMAQNGKLNL